ncbi:MAG TPA: TetR/AcrR family transcriptional regulator [Pilimelia sp.]|nr:TetR/AcrR family transcriptional regulator [Pilimelia sp.]
MHDVSPEARRVAAVRAVLPDGVTPPGTRGRILHAALELFAEFGFPGTSIRQIAARVEINSATLYAHYPAKEQILADLIRIGHEALHERLSSAVAAAGTPTDRLVALVRAHVSVHADYALLAVVANNELHALKPGLIADALRLRAESRGLLLDVLRDGADTGEFDVADRVLTATALISMGRFVAHWFGPDQPYTVAEVADHYGMLALRMVGAAGAGSPA